MPVAPRIASMWFRDPKAGEWERTVLFRKMRLWLAQGYRCVREKVSWEGRRCRKTISGVGGA